ncbi:MAG: transposase [Eubacteriales bacterium]
MTICTHNRVHLFGEIVGTTFIGNPNSPDLMVAKWLLELENKFLNVKIDKYIIMPDHIHFIIMNLGVMEDGTSDHIGSPLPDIIDWYKTMTTNEYIRGVKNGLFPSFDKHMWQRNYYEHIIRNNEDYEIIQKYIEKNPIRWNDNHNN